MNKLIESRIIREAEYIINNNSTIRNTAKNFNVSKSTTHKDLSKRLKKLNLNLYEKVKLILTKNDLEKHINGGLATKKKYENK